ncbi:MAG: TetR/AcrR family transcriptional regulator [Fusicatenibacter sp.]|nr:TetR/AcrR family transcriptional regulator [Fusicatenibacter sp.]
MDKRKEANLRVKKSIATSLLKLMHEKSFSDITISELIEAAGVARVSFYRNYASKEDVLLTLIDDVLEQFRGTIDSGEENYYTYENVRRSFLYFKRYDRIALDLYQFGYGSILLEKLNRFHEEVAGTMPNHSIEKYELYIYMGALYNTAMMWLQSGGREGVDDIAAMFCRTFGIPIRHGERIEREASDQSRR